MPRRPPIGVAIGLATAASACAQGWRTEIGYDALVAELGGAPPGRYDAIEFVAAADPDWRYRRGTSEASAPADAWRLAGFVEDPSWSTGQTPLGYGDGDDNTLLDDMRGTGGYSSVYLRREFEIVPGAVPARLLLRVYIDDGAVVWINGIEVARLNVAEGLLAYDETASNHEAEWIEIWIDSAPSVLNVGTNVLAVHAFNQNLSSSDFSIDASLASPALRVSHVEASSGTTYLPQASPNPTPIKGESYPGAGAFLGKLFHIGSIDAELTYGLSNHALTVAARFYGSFSIAPGLGLVDNYFAGTWLEGDFLQSTDPSKPPLVERNVVQNHSWIATQDEASVSELVDIIRRQDFAIHRDGFLVVAGLNNGSENDVPAVFGSCYNAITVGRSDGLHSRGGTGVDYDGPGRLKPEIVAPDLATSYSTGQVSSSATVLLAAANASGAPDAFRPETLKALLMAGATKAEFPGWSRGQTRPIDPVYGAGELNVQNSYHILAGGQTTPAESGARYGWDRSQLQGPATASYTLEIDRDIGELSVVLAWNRSIDSAPWIDGASYAETVADMSLQLHRLDASGPTLVDTSDSPVDNFEHLYARGLPAGQYALTVAADTTTEYAVAWRFEASQLPNFTMRKGATEVELQFEFTDLAPGKSYTLESSGDLLGWLEHHVFAPAGTTSSFTDPSGRSALRRFYRLRWDPIN